MRSLRFQLVISHILPLLAVAPILYIALSYLLESRLLIPTLADNLADDARLLSEVTGRVYRITGNLSDARFPLAELEMNPQIRLVFLDDRGRVEYANDPAYLDQAGETIQPAGLDRALGGETVLLTDYTFIPGRRYSIQVLSPVYGIGVDIVGVVWMTYYDAALTALFQQMRFITFLVAIGASLVGALIGSLIAVNISRPVRRAAGAISGLARGARSQPLTEQGPDEVRELSRSVNILFDRLHSLEQARRQLLANLVHELGRPLGALRAAIQALAKGAASDPQLLSELTTGMDEEAARLQVIVEELAHIHDQILGSLELNREPTDLSEWLPQVLAPWHEAAAEKEIGWSSNIPAELGALPIDRTRLGQVVGNLASNAIKYTPAGGSVRVVADRKDGAVRIEFSDTGPGIPPEEIEKVFQPFFRGSQGRRIKQGMGLGLSIAHDLAQAHGGRITVESQVGAGSHFTLTLPLEAP